MEVPRAKPVGLHVKALGHLLLPVESMYRRTRLDSFSGSLRASLYNDAIRLQAFPLSIPGAKGSLRRRVSSPWTWEN